MSNRIKICAGLVLSFPLFVVCWVLGTFVKQLPYGLAKWLADVHYRHTCRTEHDVRIPSNHAVPPYMRRWWLLRVKFLASVYLHIVFRSDDDRALHDHPWWSFSIVLSGGYFEHVIHEGGIHEHIWCPPGSMRFRWTSRKAHRLQLDKFTLIPHRVEEIPARTIFITGPVVRKWGFHDPQRGWVHSKEWEAHCDQHNIVSGTSPFY